MSARAPVGLALALLAAALAGPRVEAAPRARDPEVRYRPGDPLPALGAGARVDLGLRAAAEELASAASTVDAGLSARAVRVALARAGYPGPAQFVSAVSGAELPAGLLAAIPGGQDSDVAWAWRDFAGGQRWWVVGWSERRAEIDPLPRDLPAGGGVGLRVGGVADGRLLVAPPLGPVRDLDLAAGSTRWLGDLRAPGEYRLEVVEGDRVALLFSVFVGAGVPAVEPLSPAAPIEDPIAGAERLYARVAEYRRALGLPALTRFPGFELATREHAACLGAERVLAHESAQCSGVARAWEREWTPGARHREDLAVAATADEAWEVTWNSPGHRLNLACTDCTHLVIGAAMEPAVSPRTTYAIELLQFPSGEPRRIRDWR